MQRRRLHYPVDSNYGLALGWLLAACLAKACGGAGSAAPTALAEDLGAAQSLFGCGLPTLTLPVLRALWVRAAAERP